MSDQLGSELGFVLLRFLALRSPVQQDSETSCWIGFFLAELGSFGWKRK